MKRKEKEKIFVRTEQEQKQLTGKTKKDLKDTQKANSLLGYKACSFFANQATDAIKSKPKAYKTAIKPADEVNSKAALSAASGIKAK